MSPFHRACLAALAALPLAVSAQQAPPPDGGHPPGPPPEAVAACAGKAVGTTASFTTPDGRTLSGACTQMGDVVAAAPPHRRRGTPASGAAPGGQ